MGLTGDPQRTIHDEPTSPTEVYPVRPSDGTNFTTPGTVFDHDTGGGTQNVVGVSLRSPGSGGSTALAKAEDTAHTTGDEGIMALAVRKNVPAALAGADGDYIPLMVDRYGRLFVSRGGHADQVYFFLTAPSALVAAANTLFFDMFNADSTLIVRLLHISTIVIIEAAVTGVPSEWIFRRTTAVGTGGTALTAWLADLNDTALDADITARLKPTGGATSSTELFRRIITTEETLSPTYDTNPNLNLIPPFLADSGKGIVLRQNQGIRIEQDTSTAVGSMQILVGFTVE